MSVYLCEVSICKKVQDQAQRVKRYCFPEIMKTVLFDS